VKEWPWVSEARLLAPVLEACPAQDDRTPAEWAEGLRMAEAGNHGPFTLTGREFVRDILNDFAKPNVADIALVMGSQSGKTTTLMAGAAWCIQHSPGSVLWVMPSIQLARRFSRQRFSRMLIASPATAKLVPRGALRHTFSALEMIIGGSVFNFVGSNSPANLSSQPCRRVFMDETDRFDMGSRSEADAISLAEQRTKNAGSPQRWKTSTPTTTDNLIWREYLRGNQCRYVVPCPGCRGDLVLIWSPAYSVLPPTGKEAAVRWDAGARGADGAWDLARVERTAHVVCPYCGRQVYDAEKGAMVRAGRWVATNAAGATGYVSRHLSSLYAVTPETTWGRLAVKFLTVRDSLPGVMGFVCGDLAEPYTGQDLSRERVERIGVASEAAEDWVRIMSVDVQARAPFLWFVVRAWKGGNSIAVAAGHCDTFEELAEIQRANGVLNSRVFLDSRWGAKSEAEIYLECSKRCEFTVQPGGLGMLWGWCPVRGMESKRRWRDPLTGALVPWGVSRRDPFDGQADAGKAVIELLEFATDEFKTLLETLRRGRGGVTWAVAQEVATPEYWQHLDGQVQRSVPVGRTGRYRTVWTQRSKGWPDHLHSCETIGLAAACFLRQLSLDAPVVRAATPGA
jgi:hypothetical protein